MELTGQVGQSKSLQRPPSGVDAVRLSKSFRLCGNTKTKDGSPALILSRIGELQNSQSCPPQSYPIAAASVAQGNLRGSEV